jgi:hypothetical protein
MSDYEKNAYQRPALIPVWNMAKEYLEGKGDFEIARNPRLWRLQKAVLLVEYKSYYVDIIMKDKFGDCP